MSLTNTSINQLREEKFLIIIVNLYIKSQTKYPKGNTLKLQQKQLKGIRLRTKSQVLHYTLEIIIFFEEIQYRQPTISNNTKINKNIDNYSNTFTKKEIHTYIYKQLMIEENLISNFEISKEDDFGMANNNSQQNTREKRISKMNTHEPTTNYSQMKRDTLAALNLGDDDNNNKISNSNVDTINHKYRKTLTSGSLESNIYIKGNLVFANAAGGSNASTPRRYVSGEQDYQKVACPSPLKPVYSKEALAKLQGKKLTELRENEHLEESTDEKIHDNQSHSESGSQNSNRAIDSPQQSAQANLPVLQYEQNSSNQVEVSQNESFLHVNRSNIKSRFSKNRVSVSAFKKENSFSNPDQDNNSEHDNQNSPQSLEYIQPGTQVVLIQSHQQLPVLQEKMLKKNSQQELTGNEVDKVKFLTPAQRRKSQLNKMEVKQFQTLAEKKKGELTAQEPQSPLSAKEKFKIIGTVARTLTRLQTNQVSRIESTEQLEAEIHSLKKKVSQNKESEIENQNNNPAKNNDVNNAFNMVRMVEMICEFSERGHPEDIKNIIDILQKDPKRYLRSPDDPQHLLNKFNSKSQNASYLACKNGNLNIVQFLVKQESNFNMKSKIGGEIEDYPLQVAVRWNHKEVVDFLLNQRVIKISQQQIEAAYREAKQNKEIRRILSLHLKKKPFFLCC
ncbi:ankyrin repeat protein (macronuclear) [Tetrahymena thermophila SB210]|uniref:Ankyrin repeat protein n=1 Tax=Tetrahymena thermophila (strain SB210) TaxID=312017 RepID=I7MA64_TETTS|nr:ankyrin repeat protein [Tetrahymena thermophila SB210]EAS03794.2 ankyrin repeat protein [Tetrahymena thermophila SB210]|eukprot:XP_001024039.2 ankyrin repeat protein [Tetrahymena thermophila SB210]